MAIPQKIEKLYAWICTDVDGQEGIPSFKSGNDFYPMIGADMDRIESLRDMAMISAAELKLPLKLVCFSNKEIIEEHMGDITDAKCP